MWHGYPSRSLRPRRDGTLLQYSASGLRLRWPVSEDCASHEILNKTPRWFLQVVSSWDLWLLLGSSSYQNIIIAVRLLLAHYMRITYTILSYQRLFRLRNLAALGKSRFEPLSDVEVTTREGKMKSERWYAWSRDKSVQWIRMRKSRVIILVNDNSRIVIAGELRFEDSLVSAMLKVAGSLSRLIVPCRTSTS